MDISDSANTSSIEIDFLNDDEIVLAIRQITRTSRPTEDECVQAINELTKIKVAYLLYEMWLDGLVEITYFDQELKWIKS